MFFHNLGIHCTWKRKTKRARRLIDTENSKPSPAAASFFRLPFTHMQTRAPFARRGLAGQPSRDGMLLLIRREVGEPAACSGATEPSSVTGLVNTRKGAVQTGGQTPRQGGNAAPERRGRDTLGTSDPRGMLAGGEVAFLSPQAITSPPTHLQEPENSLPSKKTSLAVYRTA